MGPHTKKNAIGLEYDGSAQYHVEINVSRGDDQASLMDAAAHKYRRAYRTNDEAVKAVVEYAKLVSLLPKRFAYYGIALVIDTSNGLVLECRTF
jgi:hypothetical protein